MPAAQKTRVLVVDDEPHLAAGLKMNLEMEGFHADVAMTGREARQRLLDGGYDAVVLDVMLPDTDGFTLCKAMRDAGDRTPVLFLSARDTAPDRVHGLTVGADDYLTKPFELAELLARVKALLRRQAWMGPAGEEASSLSFGSAYIDFRAMEATMDAEPVKLTKLEFDLLLYFSTRPGEAVSRADLLRDVWQLGGSPNTRSVDNFLVRLRRTFERDPESPVHFISVRGVGYKFVP